MRATLLLSIALGLVCVSPAHVQKSSVTPEQDIEKILGHKPVFTPSKPDECQAKLDEWQKWGDKNGPIMARISERNQYLESRAAINRESVMETSLAFGAGIFGAFLLVKATKRLWPFSTERKQLIVLVLGATWITVAAYVAVTNDLFAAHPINLAFAIGVYSLPAILFGGIAFWWLGKAKRTTRDVVIS